MNTLRRSSSSIACFACSAMTQRLHRLDVITVNHKKIVWLDSDWQWIWSIVCRGFPHMHDGSQAWCHWTRLAAHRPWPVRNLFNVDHRRRGRLKPGGQTVGSVTSDWLTTVVLNHASIHSDAAVVSDAGLSNQTGCLDRGRTEEWELISEHSGNLSFNWIDIDRGRLERLSPGSLCFRNNVCCVWRARPVV